VHSLTCTGACLCSVSFLFSLFLLCNSITLVVVVVVVVVAAVLLLLESGDNHIKKKPRFGTLGYL